jgi:hypothetical protein
MLAVPAVHAALAAANLDTAEPVGGNRHHVACLQGDCSRQSAGQHQVARAQSIVLGG